MGFAIVLGLWLAFRGCKFDRQGQSCRGLALNKNRYRPQPLKSCNLLMRLSENSDTLFWGPYNKGPTIIGYYIRVPYFRKPSNPINCIIEPNPQALNPKTLKALKALNPKTLKALKALKALNPINPKP